MGKTLNRGQVTGGGGGINKLYHAQIQQRIRSRGDLGKLTSSSSSATSQWLFTSFLNSVPDIHP